MKSNFPIAGVVLAAGSSSRMGQPKQLISFRGKPLIVHAVEQLRDAGCRSVFTVLGAKADQIRPRLEGQETTILANRSWEEGMASSIRTVVEHIPIDVEALLIALCDQPLIETEHYRQLVHSIASTEVTIVATGYPDGTSGVPAALRRKHFHSLSRLSGDVGARRIIQANRHARIPVRGNPFDLDTPANLAELQQRDP